MKQLKILSVTVLLTGIVVAGLAYVMKQKQASAAQPVLPRLGFTLASRQVLTGRELPEPVLRATQVRYQRVDGAFRQVTTYYREDGSRRNEDNVFGMPGLGVFQVDTKKGVLIFLSPMTEGRLGASGSFKPDARQEVVMGYKTYVLRFPEGESQQYKEVYYAPDLQSLPIKHVFVSNNLVETLEPVSIDIGDPDEEVFKAIPKLPVSYDYFEFKIQEAESMNQYQAASEMRRQLQEARSSKPFEELMR